jgi:hypothetical protein
MPYDSYRQPFREHDIRAMTDISLDNEQMCFLERTQSPNANSKLIAFGLMTHLEFLTLFGSFTIV